MSFTLYLSFVLASLLLIFSPGPVNILAMSLALRGGWRGAMPSVWGATCAVLLQLALAAACLGSLLQLGDWVLTSLRWFGAGYLVYLGWQQWRAGSLTMEVAEDSRSLFWRGFATSGLNPKTLLFFPSFLPQFMRDDAPWSTTSQFLLLAASFAALFALGVAFNALCSERLRSWLARPRRAKAANKLLGSLLMLMGALLAASR